MTNKVFLLVFESVCVYIDIVSMHKLFLSLHDLFDVRQLDFSKAADIKQCTRKLYLINYSSFHWP